MRMSPRPELYRMSPLEVARGFVLDDHPGRRVRSSASDPGTPRQALEAVILLALQQRPCVVAFSGGRDSSTLLALAVTLARREGLPLPIAVTRRFPRFPETIEDEWQELVARHVGIEDWVRVDLDDDRLDLIGPVAAPRLLEHGVLWPPLAHQDAPVLERAAGGVVVDGEGGDQVFGLGVHRIDPVTLVARFPRLRTPRRILGAAAVFAPNPLQRAVVRHRLRDLGISWLHPDGEAALLDDLSREQAALPIRWDRSIRGLLGHRARRLALANRNALACAVDVTYVHPFLDRRFLEALARWGGRWGPGTRTATMQALFADVLPDAVLQRRSKAAFNRTVHGRHSRAFVAAWDGSGIDPELVDIDRLRAAWSTGSPTGRSHALLQEAWLHQQRSQPDRRDRSIP